MLGIFSLVLTVHYCPFGILFTVILDSHFASENLHMYDETLHLCVSRLP